MKRLQWILVIALLPVAASLQAQANAIEKYFSQYVEDDRFSVVYISSRLLNMMKDADIEDFDDEESKVIMEIAKDLKGLRILSTDVTPDKFYKEAKEKINTSEYEVWMTVRDKDGDNVEFLVKENKEKKIEELLMLISGDEFMLLSFVGNIDLDKVSKLADEIEKDK
ncbi:MAG: DUF4252 domain-containing protein [Saprospiraceae bacterium]|nr:DUF4252 domain-containing protein [Saprospiraceae bacterium]